MSIYEYDDGVFVRVYFLTVYTWVINSFQGSAEGAQYTFFLMVGVQICGVQTDIGVDGIIKLEICAVLHQNKIKIHSFSSPAIRFGSN